MTKKTILITGGFGFLGGRLGQHLSNHYHILLGTRIKRDTPNWLSQAKVLQIDWNSKKSLNKVCEKVDVIIHASGMNAKKCASDPEKALLVNGTFTKNLVKASISQNVGKFIYLSTVHVYSDRLLGVIRESTPTVNTHPYASSHIAGEDSVFLAIRQGYIEGAVVRIANAFGKPTHKDVDCWMLLVNDLCKQAQVKKTLTLNNDGSQVRDFVTVSDVCMAIEFLITDSQDSSNSIVNIGSGIAQTINQIALRVQDNCFIVSGVLPKINKPKLLAKKQNNSLTVQTDYLNNSDFKFTNDFDQEIRSLLDFCKEKFPPEKA